MNSPDIRDFDDVVRTALGNIVAVTPGPAPWPITAAPPTTSFAVDPRWFAAAAAGVVAVAGVGAVAMFSGRDADAPGSAAAPASVPEASSADVSIPASAPELSVPAGVPTTVVAETEPVTCGTDFPIVATVPGAPDAVEGPAPGTREPLAGQVVRHWVGNDATVEMRWPADPKVLYDLGGEAGDFGVGPRFVGLTTSPDDGSLDATLDLASVWDGEPVPSTDPASASIPLLHLEPAPSGEISDPSCDVVQLQFVGPEWRQTMGFRWGELNPAANNFVDLQPLVVASGTSGDSIEPASVTPCDTDRGVRGGTELGTPVADSPAAALLAFLTDPGNESFVQSGFREWVRNDGALYEYTYSPDYDDQMIATLVTVEPTGDGWAVTGLYHSGC